MVELSGTNKFKIGKISTIAIIKTIRNNDFFCFESKASGFMSSIWMELLFLFHKVYRPKTTIGIISVVMMWV